MKKVLFFLLLVQTIFFLYGDAGCLSKSPRHSYQGYNSEGNNNWRWGRRAPVKTQCDCNCERHLQANGICTNCGHIHVPKALHLNATGKKTPAIQPQAKQITQFAAAHARQRQQ